LKYFIPFSSHLLFLAAGCDIGFAIRLRGRRKIYYHNESTKVNSIVGSEITIFFFDKGRQEAKGPSLPLKSLPTPKLPDALLPRSAGFSAAALI